MRSAQIHLSIAILLAAPVLAVAASPFDGTWRSDPQKASLPTKPQKYELANGVFKCLTCVPMINVKADGRDQAVANDPYKETEAVRIVDGRTVAVTDRNGGRVSTYNYSVSAEGSHLVVTYSEHLYDGDQPETGTLRFVRVEKGPAGAHALSGSWRKEKMENVSENGLTTTMQSTADGITVSGGTGWSYTAKFDRRPWPAKGDPGWDTVSLRRISANSFEETDAKDGKVIWAGRWTVSGDGKTMTIAWNDRKMGTSGTDVAEKQ